MEKRISQLTKLKIKQEKEKLDTIIFTQEQERAREGLHDGVAQLLYAVLNNLQLISAAGGNDAKILKTTTDILTEAIQDTRRISFELMPRC